MRHQSIAFLLLAASIASFQGCAKEYSDRDIVFLDVEQAQVLVENREVSLFTKPRENTWLDPRSVEKYSTGHIPGAINMPYRNVAEKWEELKAYGFIVVYGNSYNDPLADAMSKTLMELGLAEVRTLRGGLQAWTDAGNPVMKGRRP
jgi:rhodanese-related sulfurtransferase